MLYGFNLALLACMSQAERSFYLGMDKLNELALVAPLDLYGQYCYKPDHGDGSKEARAVPSGLDDDLNVLLEKHMNITGILGVGMAEGTGLCNTSDL